MFGRNPRLPVDFIVGMDQPGTEVPSVYLKKKRQRMKNAYVIAMKHAEAARKKQKIGYDKKV